MIKSIYIDMDGVIADFDQHFYNLYGITVKGFEEKHGQIEFWRQVYKTPRFFVDMPSFHYLHLLLQKCHSITTDVCILSSPSWTNQALCVIQKREWIDSHIGPKFPAIFEKDKHKYANEHSLLIDDTEKQIRNWRRCEGEAHLFNEIEDCMEYLRHVALENECTMEEENDSK